MQFHFTPEKGWMNDPNGLIKINGEYHIFYQHYPDDIVWGSMHWGHAVSKDMLTFEQKPVALYPDELGYIFSGSCVLDKDNVSGLGEKDNPALLAFYTSHNPDTGEQQQSVAYSLDYESFLKYEKNPVIKNVKANKDYQVDFRDPKVFENPVKGGYTMVLAAGHHIEFFHSHNLLEWKKTGEFDPGIHGFAGICECPDCIFLSGKWILIVSSILDEACVGKPMHEKGYPNAHVMQYFVGEFDGATFVDTEKCKEPLVLDYGTDNYAMVSFANCDEAIVYGWGEHWDYVSETPANTYRGKMTAPRKLSLFRTEQGYRVAQQPMERIPVTTYMLEEESELILKNGNEHILKISLRDNEIIVDRSLAVLDMSSKYLKQACYNVLRARRLQTGTARVQVVQDENYFEIFADDGMICFSIMTY